MTKRTGFLALALAGTVLIVAAPLFAQTAPAAGQQQNLRQAITDQEIQLLRQDIRSQRKQIVAAALPLTEDEAVKFWPVYDKYIAETMKIDDTRFALIKEYATNYATMTPDQASGLIRKAIEADKTMIELRLSYIPVVEKVLPAKKAATFFQIDRRVQMLIDIQLSSGIPLLVR